MDTMRATSWQSGPQWYVVRTQYHHEARAEHNLSAGGIPTFLPLARSARREVGKPEAEPLFPQYLFARFDAGTSFRLVSYTRGVQQIVSVGGGLATVDDEAIAELRSRVGHDGYVRVGEPLRAGDRVRIDAGPFSSLSGVIERPLTAKARVAILLANLRCEVPCQWVHRSEA